MADGEPMNNGREQLPFALVRASSEHRELTCVENLLNVEHYDILTAGTESVIAVMCFPQMAVSDEISVLWLSLLHSSKKSCIKIHEKMVAYARVDAVISSCWNVVVPNATAEEAKFMWFTDEKIFTKESS